MKDLYSINLRHIFRTAREEGWPFILICIYLFFEYVRPETIYPVIDIVSYVPIILGLAFLLSIINNELGNSVPNIINRLMVLYAVVVLLSSAVSFYPAQSFSRLSVFFDWFIIYFFIVQLVNNEKRFFVFLFLFLLFSFKMSQHGFISWAKIGFAFRSWGVTGAPGWFRNSGEVGIQMCIYVPLSIAFIIATRKYLTKKWLILLSLMPFTGIGTIIASSSRGALLGLGLAGIWSILRRPKVLVLGGIALALATCITISVLPQKSEQRFAASGHDRTSLHRIERWKAGIDALNHYPVLGVGFDIWDIYYPEHYTPKIKGSSLVHNIFIQCGSELGYTGLSVFVAMIFSCFLITRKVRRLCRGHQDQFLAIMSYGFDSALVGLLASSFFVTVLYYPYFWIHCALTTCLHTAAQKKYAPLPPN